jgi:hypothetical protein
MHIEKNISDSILGILLQIPCKSKDVEKARQDMQHMGIQVDQYPFIKNGMYTLLLELYYLGNDEKTYLCKFLRGGGLRYLMVTLPVSSEWWM